MARFLARSHLPFDAAAVFAYHERPGALDRLLPPWQSVRVEQRGGIRDGERVVLRMGPGPVAVRWVAEHRGFEAGRSFSDVQVEGPFARWEHTHRFLPSPGEAGGPGAVLEDEIDYALPAGSVGRALGEGRVRRLLERMFRFRHARTASDLTQQLAFAGDAPLRVAVTGATGLVGSRLCAFLSTAGHQVQRVTRSPAPGSSDVGWDPASGRIDAAALEGVDAVVHLAGENVFGLRWTEAKRQRILDSRSVGTRLLCDALARLERPPGVLVSASAVGLYGDRGDEVVDESSEPGSGFLADVCRQWEAATEPLEKTGTRVVHLRIGIVLTADGGALAKSLPLFRMGLGGTLGGGRQGFSWISGDDVVYAIHFAMRRSDLWGAVNATAPDPVSNAQFTRVLGRVLRRPTAIPAPRFALRAVMGEMADETLLAGAFVHPAALERAGFPFAHRDLESALCLELGRLEGPRPELEHREA